MIFGEMTKPKLKALTDLTNRELAILVPLVVLILFFGVYPAPVLDVTAASVAKLVSNYETAVSAAAQASPQAGQ